MLLFADISLGEGGDLHCSRCRPQRPEQLRELADVAADVAEAARSHGTRHGLDLSFGGAEPFHHPSLSEMVASAAHAGADRIRLESDCEALASAETARAILAVGVRHLRFPMLGSTAALHDGLADRDGAFASTLRGVKTFIETAADGAIPVHVTARVPVCRHNLHDVPSTVISATEAGASVVYLIIEDTDLDLRAAAPWLEAACDSGVANSAWVDVEGMPVGLASGWELHLASLYRSVAGAKSSRCATCALNDVCGGAVRGATNAVVSSFRPPADAHRLAERIACSFEPPECEHA